MTYELKVNFFLVFYTSFIYTFGASKLSLRPEIPWQYCFIKSTNEIQY